MITVRGMHMTAFPLWVQPVLSHDPANLPGVRDHPSIARFRGHPTISIATASFGDRRDFPDDCIFLFAAQIGAKAGAGKFMCSHPLRLGTKRQRRCRHERRAN